MTESAAPTKELVLNVAVPGFWADDLYLCEEAGITSVTLPGERYMSGDFEVHAYNGHIVGFIDSSAYDRAVSLCSYTGRIVGAEVRDR